MGMSPPGGGGCCSMNQIYAPLLVRRLQPKQLHLVPAVPQGIALGVQQGDVPQLLSLTQRCPWRGGLLLPVPRARPALLTQQCTPCVNARQLLLRPLFAQAVSFCLPFRGSRWREMAFRPPANGARQLQTPAPRILQHLCSSGPCPEPVQAAQWLQPISKTHIKSSMDP